MAEERRETRGKTILAFLIKDNKGLFSTFLEITSFDAIIGDYTEIVRVALLDLESRKVRKSTMGLNSGRTFEVHG